MTDRKTPAWLRQPGSANLSHATPREPLDPLREFARVIARESIPREWGPGAQRHRRHVLRLLDDALGSTPETAFANGRADWSRERDWSLDEQITRLSETPR